jgi:hypothetical protein
MSDERRQNLLSASRGLLLVDGYLHYEANEPFIAVTSTGQTLVRSDFDMRVHARRLGGDIARFSLVDAEKAEAFANREFPNRTLPDKRYDRMSVFDGDAFPFDSFADIALTAGLQLVHDSRNQIHQMSASQVECWLDLRDETEAARGENGDSEKLVDLIDDFLRRDMPDADRMAKRELEWLDWMTDETERQHRSSVPGPIP